MLTGPQSGVQGRRLRKASQGFTLLEAMIVVAILGILATLAPPAFDYNVVSSRASLHASNLAASMQLARSEALLRNLQVKVCPANSLKTDCGSGAWEGGWIVKSASGVARSEPALPSGWAIDETTAGLSEIVFEPTGVGATPALLVVYRSNPLGRVQKCVRVSATGTAVVLTRQVDGSCT